LKSILTAASLLLLVTAAEAATVAPHRAIYDLTLLRTSEGSGVQSANGRLAFEIEGSTCDGFTVSFRMATKYRGQEGKQTIIDTMTTTYEGPGALNFRHQMKELIDRVEREDRRINVTRSAVDAPGEGTISTTPDETFALAPDTVFPMQHQLRLMALGKAGGGRDSAVMYDGSDGSQTYRAISFVGKAKPPGAIARDAANPAAAPLGKVGSWPMTVSYFKLDGDSETPDYQVSFDMYENGVANGLVLDYGEFALSGSLHELKMLPESSCP
jgi:EipB-like